MKVFFKHFRKRVIFLTLLLVIAAATGVFYLFREPDDIEIVEVEDGKVASETDVVFFDVDNSLRIGAEPSDISQKDSPDDSKSIAPELDSIKEMPEPSATKYEVEPAEAPNSIFEMRLTGVLFDGADSSAIIEFDGNDYWVSVGEQFRGFEVIKIEKRKIYLKDKNKEYSLVVGEVLYLSCDGAGDLC